MVGNSCDNLDSSVPEFTSLKRGSGIGLRREHYDYVLSERPPIPWFEVISENFMGSGGRPRNILERVRREYPVAVHGVSLSLGSVESLDPSYLHRLKELVSWVEPALVSVAAGFGPGYNLFDLTLI